MMTSSSGTSVLISEFLSIVHIDASAAQESQGRKIMEKKLRGRKGNCVRVRELGVV